MTNIFELVKRDMEKDKQNYPIVHISHLRLRRSLLPKDESVRQLVHLDLATATQLHFKAGSLGVTADELIRRLLWVSLNS